MIQKSPNNSFINELSRELRDIGRMFRYRLASGRVGLRNKYRLLRRLQIDYIVLPIGGPLPERASPPRGFLQRRLPFPPEPLSFEILSWQLERIADATNVKGVVLVLQDLPGGIAKLENLRRAIERLTSAGKECVVYTPHLNIRHYFVAAAANRIITPPSVTFDVLGLSAEAIFLKDALTKIGVSVDVFQVSPYKGTIKLDSG
jgi:protease-4